MTMSIKTAIEVFKKLPPHIAVMMQGPTGIGKSTTTGVIAAHFEVPHLDYRLSQMVEGDILGLPSIVNGVTVNNPPDWIRRACNEPVVLNLDELNRAERTVQQAVFQLILDRELHGWKLHPQTRVYTGVNVGCQYDVNSIDRALLDRFFVVEIHVTSEEWLEWAVANGVPDIIIAFIAANPSMLDAGKDAGDYKKTTSHRSWARLGAALRHAEVHEDPNSQLFYSLAVGFVGIEAAIALTGFAKTFSFQVTGEEVCADFDACRARIDKLGQEKLNLLVDRVGHHIKEVKKAITPEMAPNVTKFMRYLPHELRPVFWSRVMRGTGKDNMALVEAMKDATVVEVLEANGYDEKGNKLKEKGSS